MAGTFLIKNVPPIVPVYIASSGSWVEAPTGVKTWQIGGLSGVPAGGTGSITHTMNSPRIYLDGGTTAYRFNEIPYTGFLVTGSSIGVDGSVKWDHGMSGSLGSDPGFPFTVDITTELFPLLSSLYTRVSTEGSVSLLTVVPARYIPGPSPTSQPPPSPIRLMGLPVVTINFAIIANPIVHSSGSIVHNYDFSLGSGLRMAGAYVLWSTTLNIAPTSGSPGDSIVVTDGNNGLLNISSIIVTYESGGVQTRVVATITAQTPGSLTFTLPGGAITGVVTIEGELDGSPTSGTVFLGTLQVLNTNVSGIYTIVPDRRHDTIYDRNTPGATTNIAIPTPRIKTGFFGS